MKIVQINNVCGNGSTGRICLGISRCLNEYAIDNYILYSWGKSDYPKAIKCSETFLKVQALFSRLKGNYGFNSYKTTKIIIEKLERINPDVVHLHNMHAHNCNLDMLLCYLKKKDFKVVWTFHDCWAFTAYCPHYMLAKCEQWKDKCKCCSQYKTYSWVGDRSEYLFNRKKEAFSGLEMHVVTPSEWLAKQVRNSYLKDSPIRVINNGIDLSVFTSTPSDFRKRYNIPEEKYILLGVAIQWVQRKGADVFVELAKQLPFDKYQIVMVGTDEKIEKMLPADVIAIRRTESQKELAEIYSAADLFVNPTREEVFGLVNVEANACGTPVLTFDTGGSPECIDVTSGSVVPCDDIEAMKKEIIRICETHPYSTEACVNRAKKFEEIKKYREYVELYMELCGNSIYRGE